MTTEDVRERPEADLAVQVEQLQQALRSRDIIGQAKGILMAQHGLTSEGAFDHLRRQSQRGNTKLVEVARSVVDQISRGASF